MPKKPSPKPIVSASASKKQGSAPASKKPTTKSDDALLDEDELLSDDEEDLDDEDIDEEDLEDAVDEKEGGSDASPSVEEEVDKVPGDDDEDEEEEDAVDEEEILAKGDDLQILNLLAKKANRIEKGLDDDELIPDEEGMNSY